MCGRVSLLTYDELEVVLDAIESQRSTRIERAVKRTQARPGNQLQAITPTPVQGALEIAPFTWGFEAPWNKSLVFNTRIESALGESQMWAKAINCGRCIVPVATFFEPHGSETVPSPRTGRPMKRQYEFSSPDDGPILLASVQQEGRLSIVTTVPNSSVSPIHKRMPLVLRFEEVSTWLGDGFPALADRSGIDLLSKPEDNDEPEPPQLSLF